ncbi:MAG TPA: toxin-antitoxin system HicB family antitoxin [Actinoplanes sp.]
MAMTLRLPENLETQLQARATREGLSMNKVIERMLAAHIDEDITPVDDRQARILAAAAVQAVRYEQALDRLA